MFLALTGQKSKAIYTTGCTDEDVDFERAMWRASLERNGNVAKEKQNVNHRHCCYHDVIVGQCADKFSKKH